MFKPNKLRELSGFTLIEFLIATSIMAIFFGLGVAKYQEFNRRQILVQASQELKSNLRLAQDKALAGEKPSGWCDQQNEVLQGYRLRFSSVTTYKIEAVCSEGGAKEVQSVNLPNGVTATTEESVLFKVLAQGVEEGKTITLRSSGGDEMIITITEVGEIR